MTAADVIADGLRRAGVARVFVADDADVTLVAAVRAAGLPVIDASNAPSACVMAAVTGRLGETPGAAIVARDDPAVAHALTRAHRDAAPMIVLASHPPDRASVKAVAIAGAESAAHWVAHAAQAAMGEPPGSVWLVAAPDVVMRPALPLATALRPTLAAVAATELDAITARVTSAVRPLLVAGRECRSPATAVWVRAFAEALPAPVLTTPAARGALPEPHPLSFGVIGLESAIARRADLIIALGVDDAEIERAGVAFAAPVVRIGRVAIVLEDLAARLRVRPRADWDVAELDRIRRALAAPAMPVALAALLTRLREATPAGTTAVFADALAAASRVWQSVQPGDVLVEDDVLAAATAVALERPESLALAFGPASGDALTVATRTGVRIVTPAAEALAPAIDACVTSAAPRVLVVPLPAAGGPSIRRV